MKKLFLMMASVLLLTGCGERTSLEVFDDVINTLSEVKSIEMDTKAFVKVDAEGVALDVSLPFNLSLVENNEEATFSLDVKENAIMDQTKVYGKTNAKNFKFYFPSTVLELVLGETGGEEKWLSFSGDLTELEETEFDSEMQSKLENLDYKKIILEENFVYVDKEEDIGHYQFVINEGLIQRLATELGEEFEQTEDTSKINLKLDMYINLKTNEITKIYMNLKDMIVDIIGDSVDESEEFDPNMFKEVSIEMNFKNYNNTSVVIPEDVINEAMAYEDYLKTIISEE